MTTSPESSAIPQRPITSARRTSRRRQTDTPAGRRVGYVAAILVNLVMLYVLRHLLEWRWPPFLTNRFDDVLPFMTFSVLVTIAANVCFIAYDEGWFKSALNVVTTSIAIVVTWRVMEVFPFDFSSYERDWSPFVRLALILVMIVTTIALVAELVKLVTWPLRHDTPGHAHPA